MSNGNTLTEQYVTDHMTNIHTPDSFARALAEQVLRETAHEVRAGAKADVVLPAQVHVRPAKQAGCIRMCVDIKGVHVCYHVNV